MKREKNILNIIASSVILISVFLPWITAGMIKEKSLSAFDLVSAIIKLATSSHPDSAPPEVYLLLLLIAFPICSGFILYYELTEKKQTGIGAKIIMLVLSVFVIGGLVYAQTEMQNGFRQVSITSFLGVGLYLTILSSIYFIATVGKAPKMVPLDVTTNNQQTQNMTSSLEQLEKLGKLKEQGLITEKEFNAQKEKILQTEKPTIFEPKPIKEVIEQKIPINTPISEPKIQKPIPTPKDHSTVKTVNQKKSKKVLYISCSIFLVIVVAIIALIILTNNTKKNIQEVIDSTVAEISVSKVESSGFLTSGKDQYKPENLIDGDLKTWWTPNPKRDGVGSSMTFYFENEVEISSLEILNGSHFPDYPRLGDVFKMNNRLKVATIEFPNNTKYQFQLNDLDLMQAVNFPSTKTKSLKLTVNGIYAGSKWKDLCVSEIKFYKGIKSKDGIEAK
jgi:hypothetical protein